jgi:hypothetical protein
LGASKDFSDYESHIITFERYVKMPLEMRLLKRKQDLEVPDSIQKAKQIKNEEIINPWLITEIDCCGNDHVVQKTVP